MAEMVLLQCDIGSRAVYIACPKCGRICRQILRDEYNGGSVALLAKELTCPVCGSVYRACSTAQTREWSAAFGRYNLNGNAYNSAVRDNYARQQEQNRTNQQAKYTPIDQNWEEGKRQLFRGHITAHFKLFDTETAQKCAAAEEAAQRENGKDDIIYWNLLNQIAPKLKGFYWKGHVFESLPAFGRDALDRLWSKDHSMFPYYAGILSEKLLTQYVKLVAPKNETLKKAAAAIEDSYALEVTNGSDMRRTYYLMAYTLSGQKLLFLDGQKFRTVGELAAYMKDTLETSRQNFERLCHRMVDYDGNLDFQLETWLIAIGKQKELEIWRTSMNE